MVVRLAESCIQETQEEVFMSLFSESEDSKRKKHAKWLQGIEKTIAKRTKKLNCLIETEPVTLGSKQDILTIFHDAFGHLEDYGVVLSGETHQWSFYAITPFRSDRLIIRFEIPVQINWKAHYLHTGGPYSTRGEWVCLPKDKKRSRQINKKFPKPIIGYYAGPGITTIKEGGHICTGKEETTELFINAFTGPDVARTVSDALNRIDDVVLLLDEWSGK